MRFDSDEELDAAATQIPIGLARDHAGVVDVITMQAWYVPHAARASRRGRPRAGAPAIARGLLPCSSERARAPPLEPPTPRGQAARMLRASDPPRGAPQVL